MKELVIISGKGGTGKTSITGALASLLGNFLLCDADVDAADLHLLMAPEIKKETVFQGGCLAVINEKKCSQCGLCLELCRYGAVSPEFEVDPIACEGCGVCVDFCPEKAIDFPVSNCGNWFISETRFGPMVHAHLGIAEENSGKLVSLIRREARELAEKKHLEIILTDGPPGIGCPVIASISGADMVLINAEPTVSGLHDMERVAKLAKHFKIPAMLLVNKFDLNPDQADNLENIAAKMGLICLDRVAFDPIFTKAMIAGKTIIEYDNLSPISKNIEKIGKKILANMASPPKNITNLQSL
jgi:MinD superfamily P-loop ATPase